ncbi:MAG TPA: WcaF family extracellular polysaccharide biosynthesis acetyltransferase [Cyclobacteriaceae bacterium]|nr:WcaF family extracellular polysaccharide biosynthesis acetyltransferase [Cyclobacteriaceae bacterium]
MKVNLQEYSNEHYNPGAGMLKRLCWYVTNSIFFNSPILVPGALKTFLLRTFGAHVGKGVTIKPGVNIKYPWLLTIGNYVWIGEKVWIDCLTKVTIGDNVCLSQGSMLLTGNHNYNKTTFDLVIGQIILEEGVWIGAKSVVCPGVTCFSHSVLSVLSVATSDLEAYGIYQGNPAVKKKVRVIN